MYILGILAQKIRINHEPISFSKTAQRFSYSVFDLYPGRGFTLSWKIFFLEKKSLS